MFNFQASRYPLAAGVAGVILAAYVWVIWAPHEASSGEALANLAKAKEIWRVFTHAGGAAWWSPAFMGGTSLGTASCTLLTSLWLLGWTAVFGAGAGTKLAILACLPLAAFAMFLFARRICENEGMAFIASLVYILAPSLWMRAVAVEHVVMVLAMAWLPFVCLTLLGLAQKPGFLSAVLFALAYSVLALIYIKVALLCLPILLVFALWAVWKHCGLAAWRPPQVWLAAFLVLLALAVVPNLPSLREASSAVLFEFDPLLGWQILYSSKNGLHFMDRLGMFHSDLGGGLPETTASGAYYLGVVPLLCLAGVLLAQRRILGAADPKIVSAFRLSLAIALFCFWLSYGLLGAVTGTLVAWLGSGASLTFGSLLLWVWLAVQGWLIMALLPAGMPFRRPAAFFLIIGYFFFPGFSVLSWVPLFKEIRAPFDFYQIGGVVWTCLAVGIAAGLLLGRIRSSRLRGMAMAAALVVCVWDFSGYWHLAERMALSPEALSDFREISGYLREDPRPGSVLVISKHHYYLQLPEQTGRALLQEAFQSYLQQRGLAALFTAGKNSPDDYLQVLRLAGAGFVVIDLETQYLPAASLEEFRKSLSRVFRNRHFEVLSFANPLSPAYWAKGAVPLSSESLEGMTRAIEDSRQNRAVISPFVSGASDDGGGTFEVLLPRDFTRINPGLLEVKSPGGGGWLIIPEAWHRDWKATANGQALRVFKAFGAFPALEAGEMPRTIRFEFAPPWWYSLSAAAGTLFWASACAFSLLLLFPRFREACGRIGARSAKLMEMEREPVCRPLAITPTYNESASLPVLLEKLISCDPKLHILVVDDASPDGTAALVRKNPHYKARIFLLERAGKLGLGSAYREGFRWAMERGYDACVEIDADLSHDPADVPRLLNALETEGCDAAIGSRYINGYRVVNWPEIRLFISSFGTQFVRFFLGMPLTDATSGFKALRVRALEALSWDQIQAEGYGFQVELHYALWRSGARIVELPITFTERRQGSSKMSATIAVEAACRVLDLAFSGRRP